MNQLIGKVSSNPKIYDGNLYIAGFKLSPYGDCCASCYVQHISGTDALQDATITNVETIDSSPEMQAEDRDGSGDSYDVSESWGHRITTTKGVCSIEMRVDHNGYYGGNLECEACDTPPAKAVALDDF